MKPELPQNMEIAENQGQQEQQQRPIQAGEEAKEKMKRRSRTWCLLLLNCVFLAIGQVGGPLLVRLYFLHGGQSKWLTSWLQTAAFPILLLPISISRARSREAAGGERLPAASRDLILASASIGFLFALDSYLYSYGLSYLPVSTSTLLISTQTAFIAVFAFLIVRQKFTFCSINSVVLMTLGAVALGIHASGDRPAGVSDTKYSLGFFMTIAAAATLGVIMPTIEAAYKKVCKGAMSFHLVMQMQLFVSMFATLYCTVALLINKDFQKLSREAREYGLGEGKYYMVVVWIGIVMQLLVIGNMGVIFCSSSLFSGIFIALMLPFQQLFAVVFFHEKFTAEKGMALALSLWGFVSYFSGEYKKASNVNVADQTQPNLQPTPV